MQTSVKGLLLLCLIIGQLIAAAAQDITCPAPYVEGCDQWTWSNQAQWATLCNQYAGCAATLQSPIDIPVASLSCGTTCIRPTIVYGTNIGVNLFNIEETLALVPDSGSYVTYDDTNYNLKWVEFRQPSEHSLGGVFADFEGQFWHQSADGEYLAIAVLYKIDPNEENVFFAEFWNNIPGYSDCSCGNGRVDQGEECDSGNLNSNTIADRCRLNCVLPYCGDAVKDRTEECDNGALNNDTKPSTSTVDSSKVCRTDCFVSYCGDKVVDAGEQCDDGNQQYGDGCTPFCTSECGNGKIDGSEQCDSGTTINNEKLPNGCRPGCILYYCGDGVKDSNEQCDNGASNSNSIRNACRLNCKLPYCGDGVVDNGEQCDPLFNALCTSNCTTIVPLCGNGRIDPGEACDAGSANSYTSAHCRPDCTLPYCGDGIRDSGTLSVGVTTPIVYNETCDVIGGTTTCNPLTCSDTCGDGVVQPNEQCDLGGGIGTETGNGNLPNQCRKGCILPYCGDAIVDIDEDCDLGTSNGLNTTSCNSKCAWKYCGDGILDNLVTDRTPEQCDDGNNIDNDGCSSTCKIECGNGYIQGAEQCDMGTANANAPNKCKLNCKAPFCGDGYIDSDEECDPKAPGYNSVTCRSNCHLPYCGDSIVDTAYGEECDLGFSGNSDITSGGCSTRCTQNSCGYARPQATGDLNRAMACSGCFYSYMGSATRPPCMGSIQWLVAQSVQKISQFQIDQFNHVFGTGVKRSQQGDCQLSDPYSLRQCDCDSQIGNVVNVARAACSEVPRKPALQTTLNVIASNASATPVLQQAIMTLVSLLVREPLILPTYYGPTTTAANIIACETEAFWNRGYTDLNDAVNLLRSIGNYNSDVQPIALTALVFFEHVLQFYQSTQILTAPRSPTGTLSNALALMIGSGAQSPFLPYNWNDQSSYKETVTAELTANSSVLVQRTTSGLQARLFRSSIAFNTDPEIHRFNNIADQSVWSIRFVGVEYLKQYGYKGAADGTITFNLSDEKVILESNVLNLWNFAHDPNA